MIPDINKREKKQKKQKGWDSGRNTSTVVVFYSALYCVVIPWPLLSPLDLVNLTSPHPTSSSSSLLSCFLFSSSSLSSSCLPLVLCTYPGKWSSPDWPMLPPSFHPPTTTTTLSYTSSYLPSSSRLLISFHSSSTAPFFIHSLGFPLSTVNPPIFSFQVFPTFVASFSLSLVDSLSRFETVRLLFRP